jgi:hypothetical protein
VDSLPSSFRDPSGFVFSHQSKVYRQVNTCAADDFDQFMDSGLYDALVSRRQLLAHEDVTQSDIPRTELCHRIIRPQQVPYISYPYEWSFSQLKDAAILTLKIQAQALKHGFTLKDASAYNVQFVDSKPVFIDTLSFAPYVEGGPWEAYRQFCQHFLAPLALMAHVDIDLAKLLAIHIDGIPLPLASKLLPWRTRLNYGLQAHLHVHAKMQESHADSGASADAQTTKAGAGALSQKGLRAIIESLASTVDKLEWKPPKTEWGDYYDNTNYDDQSLQQKHELVDQFLAGIPDQLSTVHDLGANTGEFSRVATRHAGTVVSQDIDPVAVERNYRQSKVGEPCNILPLVQNLVSPSAAIGWANSERESFTERAQCDAILALALIHHLAISNNTPLQKVAELFASLGSWLVIEFVPKSDSQVVRLLATRDDIFPEYTEEGFEQAFGQQFTIERKEKLHSSDRVLYLMKSK